MTHRNGRKPPNPQKVPRGNGRKPRAAKPHSNSGSSSTGSRTMVWIAIAIFAPLPASVIGGLGYLFFKEFIA